MNRNEAHRLAFLLDENYDGNLIDVLVDVVKKAEAKSPSFYCGEKFRVTATDTPSTAAGGAYEADNCEHCHASYGHKGFCPVINRETAEAISVFNGKVSERDKIHAHALGITL